MTYKVHWTKTYYRSGVEEVKASSAKEAEDIVDNIIGNLEGSMQYDPDKNTIDAEPFVSLKKYTKVKIIQSNLITTGKVGSIKKFESKSKKYKVGFDSEWVGWYKPEDLEVYEEYT